MTASQDLKKISASSTLVGAGQGIALICQFLTGILVIRIITPEEFGLLSLALTLTGMLVIFTNFGMGLGLPRTIAKQNTSQSAKNTVGKTIISAIAASLLLSLICTLLVYFGAEKITISFNKDGLEPVLKLLSLTVLPLALITILRGIFQGLERTKPSIIFSSICINLTKLFIILLVVLTGLQFKGVLAANIITAWFTFLLFALYSLKKLKKDFVYTLTLQSSKDLLLFSFPLLGVQFLSQLITWITTLLLGYFHSAEAVGLYAAPLRLVVLLAIPLQAVTFLYLPIATRTITGNEEFDIAHLYTTVTKWIAIVTLPLALIMIFDAKFIVTILFDSKYVSSAPILATLAFAYSVHTLLGPNGMTLIAFGNRKALLLSTATGGCASTLFSFFAIPHWGAMGAAIAVCIGLIFSNFYLSYALYSTAKIHSLHPNCIKPPLLIVACATMIFLTLYSYGDASLVLHIVCYITLITLALLAPYLTRSITNEENLLLTKIISNKKLPVWLVNTLKLFIQKNSP